MGGIDALIQVMSGLPARLPAAILIVQHLRASGSKTRLPEILGRHTNMHVCLANDGMPVKEGVAYVAEPGKHLLVKNGRLVLDQGKPVRYVRPSADVLFANAAESYGPGVIGVVLSGGGSDGTEGCRRIKAAGGVTIAQDESTSRFFFMPQAAIMARSIDYVLPLQEIAGKIMEILSENLQHPEG